MTELIIFNSRGAMLPLEEIEPQLENAPPHVRESFENVRAAYDADSKVANKLKEAIDNTHRLNVELVHLTEYKRTHYKGPNATQVAKEWIAQQRLNATGRN